MEKKTDYTENSVPLPCNTAEGGGLSGEVMEDHSLIGAEFRGFLPFSKQQIEQIVRTVPGGIENTLEIYPLTPLQEGLLFHHELNESRDTYVLSQLFWIASRDKLSCMVRAVQTVIDRHEVLRSAVIWEGLQRPAQVVYRRAVLPVEEMTLASNREPIEQLKEFMKPHGRRIDLQRAPLVRLYVAADPFGENWYAVLRIHHVICDYESLKIVVDEILSYVDGVAGNLDPQVPYRVHVAQALACLQMSEAEAFFRDKLGEVTEPTAPFGLIDTHGDGRYIKEAHANLDRALAQKIRVQARRFGVSVSRVFHAAWGLVISHTSGRTDVVYGTVILSAWQRGASTRRILGMSINTLPVRLQLIDITARQLVERTQLELTELLKYEQAPLALAQRCSGVSGSRVLFSALLNYRHGKPGQLGEFTGADGIRVLSFGDALTNYPITLKVDDFGEEFALTAETDGWVDANRVAGYMSAALQSLTDALESSADSPALLLSILPVGERRQILETFNDTHVWYPNKRLIHALFEEQVERTPNSVSVSFENQKLTYAELDNRANQLAWRLQAQGIGAGSLVALYIERSVEMIVALLGVLKAGGAYVPLDPAYPAARIQYIVKDAEPLAILTQEHLMKRLPESSVAVIVLDRVFAKHTDGGLPLHRGLCVEGKDLAYVIYTSGTTGLPKGVMNQHHSVVNRLLWMQTEYRLDQDDRVLQKTPFTFDVSVWEIFWPLLSGATLVMARPGGHGDPDYLMGLISEARITVAHFVPSMLQAFLSRNPAEHCQSLRRVVCSGEELTVSLQNRFLSHLSWTRLCNLYGPTEAAIDVTFWECRKHSDLVRVPIGRPISNTKIYVLGPYRQPLPVGVIGQMYIGGVGLARGYLNRPELTAQRFEPDPFDPDSGARMYNTGDLGRWRADGNLEFVGRDDQQIKLRGFRIELGEIEAQLLRNEAVKEAAVIAQENGPGEKRLVAYITAKGSGDHLDPGELLARLETSLPEYMVPRVVVVLQKMPLTAVGKIDRSALPLVDRRTGSREYEPPQGQTEQDLAAIWRKILKVEGAGRNDNFVQLGGDSLIGMNVLQIVQSHFAVKLPIVSMVRYPTIREMAAVIDKQLAITQLPTTQESSRA